MTAQQPHKEWTGPYSNWGDARQYASGYEAPQILEKVLPAALRVKNGAAAYERDSVTFDHIQYSWPVAAALLHVALQNRGKLNVLDFGGSLGTSYFQNRKILSGASELHWGVVEQPHFAAAGRKHFASRELNFFLKADEVIEQFKPDILLISGSLQVIENARQVMEDLCSHKIPYLLIDRLPVFAGTADRIYLQHVPPSIYEASYPNYIFAEQSMIQQIETQYQIISDFKSDCDPSLVLPPDKLVHWKGYFCVRKVPSNDLRQPSPA